MCFDSQVLKNLLIFLFFALYQITVVYGGRHFDRCSVSPEMFVWLHLINPVMVD